MDLPFELRKYHKTFMKTKWKSRGVIFDGLFDEIYDIYIHCSECDKCKKKFKNSKDRQLDHDHLIIDEFNVRAILCNNCNSKNFQVSKSTNTGQDYIFKIKRKGYKQGFCYRIQREWNCKYVLETHRKTLEEAIECRDKFIAENPQYF